MQHCTSAILSVCDDIFNIETCHQLARKCRFIQRSTSKINGHEFIKALVLPSNGLCEDSLNGLGERMREFNPEANLSASAIAQRINTNTSVLFVKECFQKILNTIRDVLTKQNHLLSDSLKQFINVYIQDSTIFEINKNLARFFPGTKRGGKKGGTSCRSQVKIDLIHNYTTGQIKTVKFYKGKLPDQALSEKIVNIIKEGDLFLRDLGYFKIKSLKMIEENGAYYLTRLPSHIKVYLNEKDKEPIDLAKHLNEHYENAQVIDLNVWISDERLKTRLVAYRMPKKIVCERRRKAHKSAKEMGRTISQEKLALMHFSLFVTNIPASMVCSKIIGTIYRLRWEIELIFKTWKSDLKIDVLKGMSLYRILCLIWSRLCMVILLAYITAGFLNVAKKLCIGELSPVKITRYLLRNGTLCKAIQTQTLEVLEKKIIQDMPRRLLKDKRERSTMRERIDQLQTYYGCEQCT